MSYRLGSQAEASSRLAWTVVAALAMIFGSGAAAHGWVRTIAGELGIDDASREIARDPAGNLLAVVDAVPATAVEKYAGADGVLLWRVEDLEMPGSRAQSVAADSRGDALLLFADSSNQAVIVKRSGADGRVLWRHQSKSGLFAKVPLLVDRNGDALVVGALGNDLALLKLSGATGARLWLARVPAAARHVADAAAVDALGDVAVAGHLEDGQSAPAVVTKIAGSDGRRLWSAQLDTGSRLAGVGFDAAGDVLVGGGRQLAIDQPLAFLVVKLDGANGGVRWRDLSVVGASTAFALDDAGGVVLAGSNGELGGHPDVVVARWNPDGSHAWQRIVPPPNGTSHQARDLAVADDAVVVGGTIQIGSVRSGYFALGLAVANGASLWRVQGDGDGDLSARESRGTNGIVAGGDGSVLVAATVGDEGSGHDVVLTKLATVDGRERWRTDVRDTSAQASEVASSIALDVNGDLIAGGHLASPASGVRVGVVKLSSADGRVLWRTTIDALRGDGRVEVDLAGDVLAAGTVRVGPPVLSDGDPFGSSRPAPVALAVVRVAGDDGRETWRYVHQGGDGFATDPRTAVDGLGNVLVNAWVARDQGQQVIKLDGEDGSPLWTTPVGFRDVASATSPLVIDEADDVIAVVNAIAPPTGPSPRVVKLDGATGAIRWSADLNPGAETTAIALDAHGDVVLGGLQNGSPAVRFVSKLVGATGAAIWTADLGPGWVEDLAVAPDASVLVAGRIGPATAGVLAVVKLDGASGNARWTYRAPAETPGIASAIAVSASGEVFAAGRLEPGFVPSFAVLALSGATGTPRWTRSLPPAVPALGVEARDLVLDGRGKVVAAGALLTSLARSSDLAVVSLDAKTGRDDAACRFPRSCDGSSSMLRVPRAVEGLLPRR